MSTPYEPIIRHELGPQRLVRCRKCRDGIINRPCGDLMCECTCNDAARTAPPTWDEPQSDPEPVETWKSLPPDPANPLDLRVPSFERVSNFDPQTESWHEEEPGPVTPEVSRKQWISRFIARWELPWAATTALIYVAALIALLIAFPDVSNRWIGIFVLVSGLTASLTALASVLKTKEK